MAEMKFSPEELRELVQEAIFAKMTPEGRDALIKKALETLLAQSGIPGHNKSPIRDAFDDAVVGVAREIAREVINSQGYREKIREVCVEAIESMFAKRTEKLAEKVGDRLAELLFPWDGR
jgi:hypothetical protein